MATSALSLTDVDAFYGDSHILQKVSLTLSEGRLLGLLGRNGAGKSTCMNVIVGLLPARRGRVEVFGADVTKSPPERIAGQGVALVPQGRRVFKSLTVRENLAVAARRPDAGSRHAPWTIERSSPCSRGLLTAAARWPPTFPAANSRCSQSAAP